MARWIGFIHDQRNSALLWIVVDSVIGQFGRESREKGKREGKGGLVELDSIWWTDRSIVDWKYEYSLRWQSDVMSSQWIENQAQWKYENDIWNRQFGLS